MIRKYWSFRHQNLQSVATLGKKLKIFNIFNSNFSFSEIFSALIFHLALSSDIKFKVF